MPAHNPEWKPEILRCSRGRPGACTKAFQCNGGVESNTDTEVGRLYSLLKRKFEVGAARKGTVRKRREIGFVQVAQHTELHTMKI